MFVLDRIKMLKINDERFTPPKDFNLADFMRHSFKVMHDELYAVKVRISPGWAGWVGEKIWHESQKFSKFPDGGLEITFRVAGLDEIKRWVLSFGPELFKFFQQREIGVHLPPHLLGKMSKKTA
jgi:predicted DNA-binding transcriptional regulator YafY